MHFFKRLFGFNGGPSSSPGRLTPLENARVSAPDPPTGAAAPPVSSSEPRDDAAIHFKLGVAHRSNGSLKAAIEEYRRAIRLKPDYADAHSKLGAALCDAGDQDEGAMECREAIRLKPDDFAATYHLGNALYHKGDFSGAIAQYRSAIRLKPDLLEARNNLGNTLYRTRELNAAIAEFRELIQLAPSFRDAHNNLANALYESGDVQTAMVEYREAIRLSPDSADTHYNLANVLNEAGAADDAIVEYQHAIKLMPNFPDAHLNLGNALAGKGELDRAISEYREVLRLNPNELLARQNLQKAIAMKEQKQAKTAINKEVSPGPSGSSMVGGSVPLIKTRLDSAPIFESSKRHKDDKDNVTFLRKRTQTGRLGTVTTYEEYKAGTAAIARRFLLTKQVMEPAYYIVVETPEGVWGIDVEGLYLERLAPWQSDLRLAEVEGKTGSGLASLFGLGQAAAGNIDNFVHTVVCGRCGKDWQDGLRYQSITVVQCPQCGAKNSVDSRRFECVGLKK